MKRKVHVRPGRLEDPRTGVVRGPVQARPSSVAAAAPAGLAYILAASHSGSTLLTMLLGSHRNACTVGELKATSLGDRDQYYCSCGTRIKECGFWQRVSQGMGRRGIEFDITRAGTDVRSKASRYTDRLLQPLHRGVLLERLRDAALAVSPTWRRRLPQIQHTNAALVETISEITGKRVIVDSSKIGIRLKYLLRNPALDVRVIRLVRDGRGVALTYMDAHTYAGTQVHDNRMTSRSPALSFEQAVNQWSRSNEEADQVLSLMDSDRWMQVRYEDYCRDPKAVIGATHTFLGLDSKEARSDFRAGEHHIVGNAMRLDTTSEVNLDERWRDVLSPAQLATFNRMAGRLNRSYGYE